MKRVILLWVMMAGLLLMACNIEPKIDMSTDKKAETSMKKVYDALPKEDQERFEGALVIITMQYAFKKAFLGGLEDGDEWRKELFHGLTGKQVIAKAEEILQERAKREAEEEERNKAEMAVRERKERVEAIEELKGLEALEKQEEEAKENLKKVKVLSATFKHKKAYAGTHPTLDIKIQNNTEFPIARVFFKAIVKSPGRSVPWIEEGFNFSINGGIEPNETYEGAFRMNPFTQWGNEVPKDAILTATPVRVLGANEKVLYDVELLSDYKRKRLVELREQYGD